MLHARTRSLVAMGFAALAPPLAAQESSAVFDAPVVALGDQHRIEYVLDLDGDGDQDAFGWWWQNNLKGWVDVRGYLNDGQGVLTEAWSQSAFADWDAPFRGASAVGNFDGNAREDFAVGLGNRIHVFRSNGASKPTLAAELFLPGSEQVEALQTADFDGDGFDDLLVGTEALRIYLSAGGGGAPVPAGVLPTGASTERLVLGEIDGDGSPDAVLAQGTTLRLIPIQGGQGGSFGAETSFALSVTGEPLPVVGDVDGDGDQDVVVFGEGGDYQVLRRGGPNSFVLEPPAPGGPATDLADVNGDGALDGVCCGGGSVFDIDNDDPATFQIALGDGLGGFDAAFDIPGLGAEHLGGAVDLDADGDVDLVAGRAIYYSRGALGEAPHPVVAAPELEPREVFDVERDGDPDFAMGAGSGLRNRGDGLTAAEPPPVAAAPAGTSFVGPGFPGDYDGDGDVDLVVTHEQGGAFLSMRLLLNNGGGGFEDGGPAGAPGVDFNLPDAMPNGPRESLVADLDGDGDRDLVTGRALHTQQFGLWYELESQVWWNDGAGFFTAGPSFPGELVRGAEDLNGDGDVDLLVLNDTNFRLSWRPATAPGAWTAPIQIYFLFILYPYEDVALADFDGDGDVDVAAKDTGNSVRVALNDGAGGFGQFLFPLSFADLATFTDNDLRLLADDVNGDGHLDVVAGPVDNAPGSAYVALGQPGGGWAPPVNQLFLPAVLADVDGDGDLDGVSDVLVRCRSFDGPLAGYRLQYGDGSAGSGGMAPTLGARGPFRMGESPSVIVSGAVGGSVGLIAVGIEAGALPGLVPGATVLVNPFHPSLVVVPISFGGTGGAPGEGYLEIPVGVTPGLLGTSFYHQVIAFDAGAAGLLTASNGLELIYGQL